MTRCTTTYSNLIGVMIMSESWVEKHRPEKPEDIAGNNKAVRELVEWAKNYSEGDSAQLLVGEPGTGKTSTAMVLSNVTGYPLNIVNASLARTTSDISEVSDTIGSTPINHDYQIVLLDEVDNAAGRANKEPLYDEIRNTSNLIIATANDKYDTPNAIEYNCDVHKFSLRQSSRRNKLEDIAEKEDLEVSNDVLGQLSERPDLRSAINDLQGIADGSPVTYDNRTWSESNFNAAQALREGEDSKWKQALSPRSDAFSDPGDALQWADENCIKDYYLLEAGVAYNSMSLADISLGRAGASQDYRYWRYASAMLECLPETRLTTPYDGHLRSAFPSWFKMSTAKHDDGSGASELYQALKHEEEYRFAGSFFEFKQRILPLLQDIPTEERRDLALRHRLSDDAVEALSLDVSEYEDWRDVEAPEEGDGWEPDVESASLADW